MSSSGVNKIGPKGDPGGFVLAETLSAGTDINNVTTPGLYSSIGANSTRALNCPQDGMAFSLMVIARNGSVLDQIAIPTNVALGGSYKRTTITGAAGSWQPWSYTPSQRVDQTAGRAIYTYDHVNQREQLVYGDTGWRNISTLVNAGSVSVNASGPFIRRIGYNVIIELGDQTATDTESAVLSTTGLFTIPAGFIPDFSFGHWYRGLIARGDGPSTTAPQLEYEIPASGGNMAAVRVVQFHRTPITGTQRFGGQIRYECVSAWPTALPGTAHGSIPNL